MNATALAEVVNLPETSFADLSRDIDALAALQAEASAIEKRARQLRARVRDGMSRGEIDAFVSAGGHRASLFSTTRWESDREAACRLLSPAIVAEIFKPSTSITLRVK
jgi:hypothetical protein